MWSRASEHPRHVLPRLDCGLGGQRLHSQRFLSIAAPSLALSLDKAKVFHRISVGTGVDSLRLASVFLLADFFMTQRSDLARAQEILNRWCALAEQRLDHLTELFETGRWRRYHSELSFLENIQEAKSAVETWRKLATREAALDNSAIDISWLNSSKPVPPRRNPLADYYVLPPPRRAEVRAEPRAEAPIVPEISESVLGLAIPEQATSAQLASDLPPAPSADDSWQQALDISAMQERYPLLEHDAFRFTHSLNFENSWHIRRV
jgi:uncharacterized repeat protein (TIGR03809 family)